MPGTLDIIESQRSGSTVCSPAEKPILFSGEMVRAILDGTKTQTRRIIKPQPDTWRHDERGFEFNRTDEHRPVFADTFAKNYSPYGQPGDRLWVRETWKTGCNLDKYSPKQIRETYEDAGYRLGDRKNGKCCPMLYISDGEHKRWGDHDIADFGEWGKTRVSIHMPRWASRITLEINGVRIESLHDITEDDARAEGVSTQLNGKGILSNVEAFRMLWTRINGASSWTQNPWVWVVEFRRI